MEDGTTTDMVESMFEVIYWLMIFYMCIWGMLFLEVLDEVEEAFTMFGFLFDEVLRCFAAWEDVACLTGVLKATKGTEVLAAACRAPRWEWVASGPRWMEGWRRRRLLTASSLPLGLVILQLQQVWEVLATGMAQQCGLA